MNRPFFQDSRNWLHHCVDTHLGAAFVSRSVASKLRDASQEETQHRACTENSSCWRQMLNPRLLHFQTQQPKALLLDEFCHERGSDNSATPRFPAARRTLTGCTQPVCHAALRCALFVIEAQ